MRWNWLVERRIQEALQAGEFDNLPGKGMPLQLEENPLADPAWRLAHRVLENAGLAPLWVEMMREARRELERARDQWRQAWLSSPDDSAERARAERQFELRIAAVNKRIAEINLSVPLPAFQWLIIDPALEKLKVQKS